VLVAAVAKLYGVASTVGAGVGMIAALAGVDSTVEIA